MEILAFFIIKLKSHINLDITLLPKKNIDVYIRKKINIYFFKKIYYNEKRKNERRKNT